MLKSAENLPDIHINNIKILKRKLRKTIEAYNTKQDSKNFRERDIQHKKASKKTGNYSLSINSYRPK